VKRPHLHVWLILVVMTRVNRVCVCVCVCVCVTLVYCGQTPLRNELVLQRENSHAQRTSTVHWWSGFADRKSDRSERTQRSAVTAEA